MTRWTPPSARYSRRKRIAWEILGLRERVALRLAPWLAPRATARVNGRADFGLIAFGEHQARLAEAERERRSE